MTNYKVMIAHDEICLYDTMTLNEEKDEKKYFFITFSVLRNYRKILMQIVLLNIEDTALLVQCRELEGQQLLDHDHPRCWGSSSVWDLFGERRAFDQINTNASSISSGATTGKQLLVDRPGSRVSIMYAVSESH
jgi:hypothetical protein